MKLIAGLAVAGGLVAGALGFGAASATAEPVPPFDPDYPTPVPEVPGEPSVWLPPVAAPPGASVGEPPEWAPPKPAEPSWAAGNPQVWDQTWGHWGVWMNGVFIPTY